MHNIIRSLISVRMASLRRTQGKSEQAVSSQHKDLYYDEPDMFLDAVTHMESPSYTDRRRRPFSHSEHLHRELF